MKLTTRGWVVLVIIPAIIATLFISYVTRDICWVGDGYGSCSKMIDQVTNTPHHIETETMP
jgi:hypothetical protein